MDKKRLKRIIAREGLIIFVILLPVLYLTIGKSSKGWMIPYAAVLFSASIIYGFIWLIRFIIWAVRTLKERI
jgi:hypothetical protein